jgi:TetR/AcrR family transcriptional regulator
VRVERDRRGGGGLLHPGDPTTDLNARSILCYRSNVANGEDKFSEKRVEILKTAAAAFRRRGYHGASVDEIATALEMTKGNLYYYFRNKEDILYACHDYSLNLILELLDEIRREPIAADEKLRRLVVAFVHLIIDELHGTALTLDLQALSPALLRKVIARRDRFDRGLRAIIQEGIDEGLFAVDNPKLVAFAIMGAVNWIPKWFDPEGASTSSEIGETFAKYLLSGLRSRDQAGAGIQAGPGRTKGRPLHRGASGSRSTAVPVHS